MKKPDHFAFIHCLPVEILSLIFVFVKETYDDNHNKPSFSRLPYPSSPLRVGAVCKKWRDVTTRTPQLWTDIALDLMKPANAQLNLVNEWARRSGSLPLNITIFLGKGCLEHENTILEECKPVVKALRSLSVRWNDVALRAPWSFCHELLNELEGSTTIGAFHIRMSEVYGGDPYPIKLKDPFRPKRFYSCDISGTEIPFEWDNLVHLEITIIDKGELLHILRHAHRLKHCDAGAGSFIESTQFPVPTTLVTNHSLIHLQTVNDVIAHLTLPSLQYLDYLTTTRTSGSTVPLDSVIEFVGRSRPPLQTFILHCEIFIGDPTPRFEELSGLTELSVIVFTQAEDDVRIDRFLHTLAQPSPEIILPHLRKLTFDLPSMSSSSWSLFSRLFRQDIQADTPGLENMKASVTLGRPLSMVQIYISDDIQVTIDKDTFMHLVAVRKSGVDLILQANRGGNLFRKMAELYDVKL